MINIVIRVSNHIDLLHHVVNEVARYKMWTVNYGEEWVERVNEIKAAINSLYDQKVDNSELTISLSFLAGQLLKRIILYYIKENELDDSVKDKLINFVITIEGRIEDEVYMNATTYFIDTKAYDKRN